LREDTAVADQEYAPRTADRADAFVRRQALWSRLLDLFRRHRPTDEQLRQVSTLAEVAIDQVFSAYRLTEEQQVERHGTVKDYAECAALYGFVLGYWQARQEIERRAAAIVPVPPA
jgi:hypothetical protein